MHHVKTLEKSVATKLGLKKTVDFLKLNSSAAIVIDQTTGEVLFEKNADVALPIASLTKLMTALIIENQLNLRKSIKITKREANLERYNYSRLKVGSQFTRSTATPFGLCRLKIEQPLLWEGPFLVG